MITVAVAYFVIVCYTSTIASCQTFFGLPDVQACSEIVNKIKAKRPGARLEQCDTHRTLVLAGPRGPQGLQGVAGLQGPMGPVGPIGPQGPAGSGTGTAITYCPTSSVLCAQ